MQGFRRERSFIELLGERASPGYLRSSLLGEPASWELAYQEAIASESRRLAAREAGVSERKPLRKQGIRSLLLEELSSQKTSVSESYGVLSFLLEKRFSRKAGFPGDELLGKLAFGKQTRNASFSGKCRPTELVSLRRGYFEDELFCDPDT